MIAVAGDDDAHERRAHGGRALQTVAQELLAALEIRGRRRTGEHGAAAGFQMQSKPRGRHKLAHCRRRGHERSLSAGRELWHRFRWRLLLGPCRIPNTFP